MLRAGLGDQRHRQPEGRQGRQEQEPVEPRPQEPPSPGPREIPGLLEATGTGPLPEGVEDGHDAHRRQKADLGDQSAPVVGVGEVAQRQAPVVDQAEARGEDHDPGDAPEQPEAPAGRGHHAPPGVPAARRPGGGDGHHPDGDHPPDPGRRAEDVEEAHKRPYVVPHAR